MLQIAGLVQGLDFVAIVRMRKTVKKSAALIFSFFWIKPKGQNTWGFASNSTSFFFLIRKTKQKESRKIDPIFPRGLPMPGDFSGLPQEMFHIYMVVEEGY